MKQLVKEIEHKLINIGFNRIYIDGHELFEIDQFYVTIGTYGNNVTSIILYNGEFCSLKEVVLTQGHKTPIEYIRVLLSDDRFKPQLRLIKINHIKSKLNE